MLSWLGAMDGLNWEPGVVECLILKSYEELSPWVLFSRWKISSSRMPLAGNSPKWILSEALLSKKNLMWILSYHGTNENSVCQ